MASNSNINIASLSPPIAENRRRKVRKGTRSCWACKRKKTKCTFPATDGPCLNCQRHGTSCVMQDVDVSEELQADAKSVGDRLGKIEHLLEALLPRHGEETPSHGGPAAQLPESLVPVRNPEDVEEYNGSTSAARSSTHSHATGSVSALQIDTPQQILLAAWPPLPYLQVLFGKDNQTRDAGGSVLHGMAFRSYDKLDFRTTPSPSELLEHPPPTTHAVLIARQLLLLSLFLQDISTEEADRIFHSKINHRDVRLKAIKAASRVVTSNDEYAGSIEHVECLMLESSYWNNEGDFHRAYLVLHRALAASRILGLDRGVDVTASVSLHDKTKERIDSTYMWFRMVQSDRYLSLMLGLPSGTTDRHLYEAGPRMNADPVEYLEQVHCVVGGLLMARGHSEILDVHATSKIDMMLQSSVFSLPSQWWLTVDVSTPAKRSPEAMAQVTNQLVHYHLLQRLHLPYLLCHQNSSSCDYSTTAAVQASREILTRFICYRKVIRGNSFCRGTNFLAFMSALVLCLGHIQNNRRGSGFSQSSATGGLFSHQRPVDRGTMERMIHVMQMHHAHDDESDPVTAQTIDVTKHLLDMETASAAGQCFQITHHTGTSANCHKSGLGFAGTLSEGSNLTISIPYIGVVRIDRDDVLEPGVPGVISADPMPEVEEYIDLPVSYKQSTQAPQQGVWHSLLPGLDIGSIPNTNDMWTISPGSSLYNGIDEIPE